MSSERGYESAAVVDDDGDYREVGPSEGRVWVVTNDPCLADLLVDLVKERIGADGVHLTFTAWLQAPRAERRAPAAIIDLRDGELWDTLREQFEQSGGASSPLIGVVDRGLPLQWATFADQVLAAAVAWPCPPDRLSSALRAVEQLRRSGQLPVLNGCRALRGAHQTFLSHTASLFPVIDELTVAARHGYTLLFVGETGTGKTTLARLVHELSPRGKKGLMVVSCGALPTDIMGSELFGHVKGAFTGADKNKIGKFEAANGGTMVLEEIDTLDLVQQAKLLRVLETGEFEPVGSNETRKVDVRVIVTSNADLEALVAAGRFRADLYFRLKQLRFDLPPLRKRLKDIVWLTVSMIEECCRATGQTVDRVDPEFFELLKFYSWPGNIRDLRNEVHRAVLFCRQGVLTRECLTSDVLREAERARENCGRTPKSNLADDVAETEIEAIERMLRATDFNRAAAARALGISRVTLYNKIRKYKIRLEGDSRK